MEAHTTSGQSGEGTTTVELAVLDMHCSACVALIEETLLEDLEVPAVSVDLETGRALVTYDPGSLSVTEICKAVAMAGYVATPVAAGGTAG